MRNGGRQNERQVMIRIIKLLFSFADMAERAAYRSILVRTFLLTLFRIAEPVARRYVLRYDGNVIKIPEPMRGDNISGRAETLHLAWLFRVFATMLSNLMAWRDMGRIQTSPIAARRTSQRAASHTISCGQHRSVAGMAQWWVRPTAGQAARSAGRRSRHHRCRASPARFSASWSRPTSRRPLRPSSAQTGFRS